jgi:murein DD-endopeptidase MepM/ murein hydrolase activator NlpD
MNIKSHGWLDRLAWILPFGLVLLALYLGWEKLSPIQYSIPDTNQKPTAVVVQSFDDDVSLPDYDGSETQDQLQRKANIDTEVPNRPRSEITDYTVTKGDSVFAIAAEFNITPETVLWSNYDVLKDDPHALSAGMELKIPPIDGVYYQWQDGETLEQVAAKFETDVDSILTWTANRIDLTDPQFEALSWVMIPSGQRAFQQWIVPVPARGSAGVSTGIYGGGACPGGYDGLYGSGAFIWPSSNRALSGNDYWSGHLAIDIGSAIGEPIIASDAGVIMFAGWSSGGYGYTVAIDHGNGYQTLYGHLSSVNANCGQSVRQGQMIGLGGSSGNSTGPHLHFEIRLNGGFVNPWFVLPAP